ncbi:MAG TPA: PQQ-binding-like beta-propeller repeat protein [Nitrososphaerales archaeon]|nr:PQQ-binding-like beta-propeller repeat protein [Nitrososphaerales archaeon]
MLVKFNTASSSALRVVADWGRYAKLLLIVAALIFSSLISLSLSVNASTNSAASVDSTWAFQNQNQQNTGYSPQTLVNTSNVGKLSVLWSTVIGGLSGTPVVVNSIVYVTGDSSVWAVNELTGKIIWVDGPTTGLAKYTFATRSGVTVDNGQVFAGTTNNYLLSLKASTGALTWKSLITKGVVGSQKKYSGAEATPLVYSGKVIVGETSGDGGTRGLVRAFSESNGALLWTFYTVPPSPITSSNQASYGNSWGTDSTGCKCGGGAVWNAPAVDPATGIIYFGTGNPFPGGSGVKTRTPTYPSSVYSNLYTDSVIALNSATGKLVWYFQEVPGDQRDYDVGMPVQLFTTTINGVPTEVVGSGGKIGYYFLMNAHTGALIYKAKLGIHLNDNSTEGVFPSSQIYPGNDGGVDSFSTFNPVTKMIYVMDYNEPLSCMVETSCTVNRNSTLYAIDASNGAVTWTVNMVGMGGGVSSTNDLVFTSDGNHNFYALNALTAAVLWTHNDPTGGNAGVLYWSWGPPSITNGRVFETTMGSSTTGLLEAYVT